MQVETTEARDFIVSASSRETSGEVMVAITRLARDVRDAERIWADPTNDELLAIWESVTGNGLHAASDYCWGASGDQWGSSIEAKLEEGFRAAYLPAPQNSTGGGFLLTTEQQACMDDEALRAAAIPVLAEYNRAAEAIGEATRDASEICIGLWKD